MAGRNLSRHALSYLAAQLAANAVGFFTAVILARVFTKQQMGDYQQLMFVYTVFSGVLIAGLPSCLTYFYPTVEEDRKATTVYIVLGGLFLLGIVIGAATFFASPLVESYFKNVRLGPLIRNFFLFYAFTLGSAYIRRFLVAIKHYRFLLFWLPFDRVLMMMSFVLPALLGMGLERIVLIAVWVSGLKFVITTVYTMRVVPLREFVWDSELASKMLFFSLPLGLSSAVGQMSRQVDRAVIGHFTTPEFFATFTWAAMALPFIVEIPESVMTVLTPELALLYKRGEYGKFISIWQESIRKVAIIVLGTFGIVQALAGPLIIAMYSEKYADSVLYFRLYQITLMLRVTLYGPVLQAIGRTSQIFYGAIVFLVVRLFLSVYLYKLIGPTGPVFSSIVISFCSMAFFLFFISRFLKTRPTRLWPWSYHFRILGASVLAGAAACAVYLIPKTSIVAGLAAVSQWLAGKPSAVAAVQCAIGGAIFVPTYLVFLHLFKTLKDKDWVLFREMTYGRFVGKQPAPPSDI